MKNNHEKKEDDPLQTLLQRAHRSIDIPDGKPSWLNVEARINKKHRQKQWMRKLKVSVLLLAGSTVISLAVTADLPKAYSQFTGLMRSVQHNMVDIFFQPDQRATSMPSAKTSPPPAAGNTPEGLIPVDTDLSDAKAKLDFALALPDYVPKGYTLDIVRIYKDADNVYRSAFMEYVNEEGRIIQLNQRLVRDGSAPELSSIHTDAAIIEDIRIHGNKAVMVTYENDYKQLEWLSSEQVRLTLFGLLPESEIRKMAESL
jgi:hypothetical protein